MVDMKTSYKGYELRVERDQSLCGYEYLYYSIYRESDGYCCAESFSSGEETEEEFIEILKERVDNELKEDNPWEEEL